MVVRSKQDVEEVGFGSTSGAPVPSAHTHIPLQILEVYTGVCGEKWPRLTYLIGVGDSTLPHLQVLHVRRW